MTEPQIQIEQLTKTYRVPVRTEGLRASLKSLLHRTYNDVEAVRGVSFSAHAGEMVGLIGPNGAGKTTTLKMLSGLLHPTGGRVSIDGFVPWERKPDYLRRISMVMGNKSQMLWDIPPMDSFRVLGEIYSVPAVRLRQTLDELIDLLDMGELLNKPVRNLSLGERMKCELVASLLHRPAVLFLDEPTLGLDVSMQLRLRRFLADYNRRSGVTVILTSHYMADVMALCRRVILIHHGRVIYDGELNGLAQKLAPFKLLRVSLQTSEVETSNVLGGFQTSEVANDNVSKTGSVKTSEVFPVGVEVIEREADRLVLRVPRAEAPALTARLLDTLPVADLTVEDPPIEAVIDQIYTEGDV